MEYEKILDEIKCLQDLRDNQTQKHIVNTGLLKAGKSTLFNAILGRSEFSSDVVRSTVVNQMVSWNDCVLVDTPGLDAREEDTQQALSAYQDADALIYVHNLQDGELTQSEINNIISISDCFGSSDAFFQNSILVLSHRDQMEDEYEAISARICEQCQNTLHQTFSNVFCVDAIGYLKGVQENKKLLIAESKIPELIVTIKSIAAQNSGLQSARLQKEKECILAEIDKSIATLRSKLPDVPQDRCFEIQKKCNEVERIYQAVVRDAGQIQVDIAHYDTKFFSNFPFLYNLKHSSRYSSQSSAHSAAMDAITRAISEAARTSKQTAMNVVSTVENYIRPSDITTKIRDKYATAYEAMRKCAPRPLSTGFDMKVHDFTSDAQTIRFLHDRARYIAADSFSSAYHYATAYSSNLDIDYDEFEQYVDGLFGSHYKTVKQYYYDASGAGDDIASDMAEKVNDIADEARRIIQPALKKMSEDLSMQFTQVYTKILKEFYQWILEERANQMDLQNKRNALLESIANLEKQRNVVRGI